LDEKLVGLKSACKPSIHHPKYGCFSAQGLRGKRQTSATDVSMRLLPKHEKERKKKAAGNLRHVVTDLNEDLRVGPLLGKYCIM